ncbi:MAG: type II toxin-antitoxin system VapC family toxin [Anaerolineales bacterium]|nr:type II toxin-antitoxin system VapC family toxin [Anaerolineales bacterium]
MNDRLTVFVLDSFALLAYLGGESGQMRVKEILHDASHGENRAVMSLINLGEVVYITERERGLAKAQEVLAMIEQLPFEILPVVRQTVLAAAHIKAVYPVAYADAFAIATAQEHEGTLVTGDPEINSVKDIVEIEWIG